jgi:hypothetical protein
LRIARPPAAAVAAAKSPNSRRSSSIGLWSCEMLVTIATRGRNSAIEPSLSSTSLTKASPRPTLALAKGISGVMKSFITAPFMIVGSRPAASRIQPIMPVVVDFPLVPPTAMPSGAALNSRASSSARRSAGMPSRRAATTSGTVSSTAAEVTRICSARVTPLPSCACSGMPRARRNSNFRASRPWSSERSEPSTATPCALRISASGNIPLPPIPQKKYGRVRSSAGAGEVMRPDGTGARGGKWGNGGAAISTARFRRRREVVPGISIESTNAGVPAP